MKQICAMSLAVVLAAGAARADLDTYVEQADESFKYEVVSRQAVGKTTTYIVKLTSQTWRGITWSHWLSILVPQQVEHPDHAILLIAGGSNSSGPPDASGHEALVVANIADRCGAVLAILQQVPNQPLFNGLSEDALIAHTFDGFLSSGDADWPLLLPMVKSSVRAMDTVQSVARGQMGSEIKNFIVTGASKRGWTTWLTAAVDPRVSAIAPMVIDILNIGPQLAQQKRTYGDGYSPQISDYVEAGVIERMDSDLGERLLRIVDPFTYRERLTMPKLIVLGTNDPFWTVDAASLYVSDLPDPAHLHYEPNAGHGLGVGIYPTLIAFFDAVMAGDPLPKVEWRRDKGNLTVQWDCPDAKAVLWQAESPDRDFREAMWVPRPLAGKGSVQVQINPPAQGCLAYYVQIQFPVPDQLPYKLSTEITVLPEEDTVTG